TEYAYERVPKKEDPFDNETFMKSGVPFYAVVTNVRTGEAEYIKINDVFKQMDVLRASGSMPIVSRPVMYNGSMYLDGGVADSIPYEWFYHQGYTRQVVILTRDSSYVKKPFSPVMADMFVRKYPRLRDKMLHRHIDYNNKTAALAELEAQGKVFIIRPSEPITISRLEKDEDKLQQTYDMGRRDSLKLLEDVKKFLDLD
ncbi:MAG: patatin family protein, partial [Parasporobacterium sp.]|nr:patatin family protein [Parasporobacterium sp.]